MQNGEWQTNRPLTDLTEETREILEEELERRIAGATLFQRENPLVRHVVLRKRQQLEDAGLLAKVGVDVHPEREQVSEQRAFDALFEGKALRTSEDFRQAYGEARAFGKALARRGKGSGFMKNLMEQRICSSIHAGLATARRLLQGDAEHEEDEEQEADIKVETGEEREVLQRLISRLERLETDPKMEAVVHFLDKEKWLDLGVIIFSQYYDTAQLAGRLAGSPLPGRSHRPVRRRGPQPPLPARRQRDRRARNAQAHGGRASDSRHGGHRCRVRRLEPASLGRADQRRSAVEPDTARTAHWAHQTLRAAARNRGYAEPRVRADRGREDLRAPVGTHEEPLRPLRLAA